MTDIETTVADPEAAGVIIAAIIGAIATAATTAGSALATEMNKSGAKINQGAVMQNETMLEWKLMHSAQPTHGQWNESPSQKIEARPTPQVVFDAWKASGDAPKSVAKIVDVDDLSQAQQLLLAAWIKKDDKIDAIGAMSLKSSGAGVDSIAVYHDADRKYAVALYLSTPAVGGTIKGGCTAADFSWMKDAIDKDDDKLSGLRNHIRKIDSDHTKLSEGASKSVEIGDLKVRFTAAKDMVFVIKDKS